MISYHKYTYFYNSNLKGLNVHSETWVKAKAVYFIKILTINKTKLKD
jgi:hypothetical protein